MGKTMKNYSPGGERINRTGFEKNGLERKSNSSENLVVRNIQSRSINFVSEWSIFESTNLSNVSNHYLGDDFIIECND